MSCLPLVVTPGDAPVRTRVAAMMPYFKAPVHVGAEVIATVKITDLIPEKRRAIFHCVCKVSEKAVVEGEAVIMVPSREPKK